MATKQTHHWLLERTNGLHFKECLECGETNTVEYHFDCVDGDIVNCDDCGSGHEITAI